MKKFIVIIFLFLIILITSCSSDNGNIITETTNEYSSTGVEKIELRNITGDVEIDTWNSDKIRVTYFKRSWFADAVENTDIDIDEGKILKIKTKFDDIFARDNTSVIFKLSIPENIEVKVSTVTGDLYIDDITYIDRAETVTGDIRADILNAKGDVQFKTVTGDINLEVAPGSYDRIKTDVITGDVNIDVPKSSSGNHDIELKTTTGDINVDEY